MLNNIAAGGIIAQAVIDPNAGTVLKQFGFKPGISTIPGSYGLTLNPDMNFASAADRQVLATLDLPAGAVAAMLTQVQVGGDAQSLRVLTYNVAGVQTAPAAGSQLTITVIRSSLPQG